MRFNLVTVIEDVEDVEHAVRAAITEFHTLLQSVGHQVTKATLTGDNGSKDMTPAVPEPMSEPAAESSTPAHVASTLDS